MKRPSIASFLLASAASSLLVGEVVLQPYQNHDFQATVLDQFGNPLEAQPLIIWSATGGGLDSPVGATSTFSAGPTLGTYEIMATSSGYSSSRDIRITDEDPSLILHYRLDEPEGETIALDSTPYGRDGIVQSAGFQPTSGKRRGALAFSDSPGEQLVNTGAGDYLNGLEAITIAVWIQSANAGVDNGFLTTEEPDGWGGGLMMRYASSGPYANETEAGPTTDVIQIKIPTTEGVVGYETTENSHTTDWQHVAITWQRGQLPKVYIDGFQDTPTFNGIEGLGIVDGAVSYGEIAGIQQLIIGKGAADTSGSWNGLVDDLRIYDRVLDPAEIAVLHTTGLDLWVEERAIENVAIDNDGNGQADLMDYLHGNPEAPDLPYRMEAIIRQDLPEFGYSSVLEMDFPLRRDRSGVLYSVEVSETLEARSWQTAENLKLVLIDDTDPDFQTWAARVNIEEKPIVFMRIRATTE